MSRRMGSGPALITCPKCQGSGELRSFMHIDNGRCFTCGGAGMIENDPSSPRLRPNRNALERWRGEFRARYRNITSGRVSAEEAWDLLTSDEGSAWQPDAVRESLDLIGATEAFRALGWPV